MIDILSSSLIYIYGDARTKVRAMLNDTLLVNKFVIARDLFLTNHLQDNI